VSRFAVLPGANVAGGLVLPHAAAGAGGVSDTFATDTIASGRWVHDVGAGFAVSGGKLTPAGGASNKVLTDTTSSIGDGVIKVDAFYGGGISNYGMICCRIAGPKFIYLDISHSGDVTWYKYDAGFSVVKATVNIGAVDADARYEIHRVGNLLSFKVYNRDDETLVTTQTYTLVGGDPGFGGAAGLAGVQQYQGVVSFDNWVVTPA
jgi:hypothetical protein